MLNFIYFFNPIYFGVEPFFSLFNLFIIIFYYVIDTELVGKIFPFSLLHQWKLLFGNTIKNIKK